MDPCKFRPGLAVAVRWLGAFAVAMSFSWLDSWRVWVFFTVEASIVGVAVLFAFWALGETRGRSLEHVRQQACFCAITTSTEKQQHIDHVDYFCGWDFAAAGG